MNILVKKLDRNNSFRIIKAQFKKDIYIEFKSHLANYFLYLLIIPVYFLFKTHSFNVNKWIIILMLLNFISDAFFLEYKEDLLIRYLPINIREYSYSKMLFNVLIRFISAFFPLLMLIYYCNITFSILSIFTYIILTVSTTYNYSIYEILNHISKLGKYYYFFILNNILIYCIFGISIILLYKSKLLLFTLSIIFYIMLLLINYRRFKLLTEKYNEIW